MAWDTCREFADNLTEYLEDALSPADVDAIAEHLELCDGCSNLLQQQRIASDVVAHTEPPKLTDGKFEEMMNANESTFIRLARSYTDSHAVAEEVVQDAWIAILKGLPSFRGDSSLRTWMCQIVINIARRQGQRERRAMPEPYYEDASLFTQDGAYVDHWLKQPNDWSTVPEEQLMGNELKTEVTRVIASLPDQQREVIELRDIDGFTAEEVAGYLEISEGNVRVILHRARKVVRAAIDDYLKAAA